MRIGASSDRPVEDLKARARILDAAFEQFAVRGFAGATIRGIARAAGVSPGLVQHHFHSKESLRRACDEMVLELVRRKLQAATSGAIADPGFLAGLIADGRPLLRYLARAITDGSADVTGLLDEMATGTEAFLVGTWPERFAPGGQRAGETAAALVAQGIGSLLLHEYVAHRMGLDPQEGAFAPRFGLAQLDAYESLGRYLASGIGDAIRRAAAESATTKETQ